MRSHEEYKEMLPAYALDALDANDVGELENYLRTSEELQGELKEWRATASLLAYAAPVVEPSDSVREKLFANIRKQSREQAKVISVEEKRVPVEAKPVQTNNVVIFPMQKTKSGWNAFQVVMAAAASVAIVFLATLLWMTWQNNKASQSEIADLRNRLEQTQKELAQSREENVLGSPESQKVALAGLGTAPKAQAFLAYDKKTGNAVLIAEGLPSVPAGKAYQIWYITDMANPTPGKTFKPDANGKATLRDRIPSGSIQATVFAVTIEDEKGATSPTLDTICLKSAS